MPQITRIRLSPNVGPNRKCGETDFYRIAKHDRMVVQQVRLIKDKDEKESVLARWTADEWNGIAEFQGS